MEGTENGQRFNPQLPSTNSEMCARIEGQENFSEQQRNLQIYLAG
jgi:hypothetical protein